MALRTTSTKGELMKKLNIESDQLKRFVIESNRIERIVRSHEALQAEVTAHRHFLLRDEVSVAGLNALLAVLAPGALLRSQRGMDVTVGRYQPPAGGPDVLTELTTFCHLITVITKNGHSRAKAYHSRRYSSSKARSRDRVGHCRPC